LQFDDDTSATRNAVAVGALLIILEAVTLSAFRLWEEWLNVALGAWLVLSPWALGITVSAAQANFVGVGLLVLVAALHEIWDLSRNPPYQT
jgi:hypothetical protein